MGNYNFAITVEKAKQPIDIGLPSYSAFIKLSVGKFLKELRRNKAFCFNELDDSDYFLDNLIRKCIKKLLDRDSSGFCSVELDCPFHLVKLAEL